MTVYIKDVFIRLNNYRMRILIVPLIYGVLMYLVSDNLNKAISNYLGFFAGYTGLMLIGIIFSKARRKN